LDPKTRMNGTPRNEDATPALCPSLRRSARAGALLFPQAGLQTGLLISERLKRSRETWERVDYLVRNHLRLVSAPEMRLSTLKRMLAEDGFDELLWLARIDALASNGDLGFVMFCERRREEIGAEAVKPPRLLTGHDLIAMGFEPGPRIGEVLRALETAQLEGEVVTREDALAWVRRVTGAPSSGASNA